MIKFETTVNGKTLTFYDDRLSYGGHEILFSEISNIAHKGGDNPAMVFNYKGKRVALPYPAADERPVIAIFKRIHIQNKSTEEKGPVSDLAENSAASAVSTQAEYGAEPHTDPEAAGHVKASRAKRKGNKKQKAPKEDTVYSDSAAGKHKGFWSLGRLIIGIVSMVLSLIILFQSCAAGIVNTLSESEDVGGTAGLITAIMILASGIVAVASRNSRKKAPVIAAVLLYAVAAAVALANCAVYKDLMIWGILCICFAAVFVICIIKHRN